jgi:hypothetical protein
MKTLLFTLIFMTLGLFAKADQLQWLSKEDADNGKTVIEELGMVYLYCGCCDSDVPALAAVIDVTVTYTGTDNYYELVLEYVDVTGEVQSTTLDLAYVWTIYEGQKETVGSLLGLEHDSCSDGHLPLVD